MFFQGKVSLVLAESMGYCWGVERAVQMAYEAVNAFPGRQLHLTNEIIHNPGVNTVHKSMKFTSGCSHYEQEMLRSSLSSSCGGEGGGSWH